MNQVIDVIFQVIVIIFSVVVHEVSHGAMAYALGDTTAKDAGRLTLNPIPHIDPIGSIVMPLLIGFGWARPVPYNPYNLRNQKWGPLLVGVAGPLSNIALAVVFGIFIRFSGALYFLGAGFFNIAFSIVLLNLGLAIFNLIPIPPLDGSKVLLAFWPAGWADIEIFLERYGFFLILILVLLAPNFLSGIIMPIAQFFFRLITGTGF